MKIDLRVESQMLAQPEFQAALLQACTDLSLESTVKSVCIHEAGHLIYFEIIRELMGPGIPELLIVGPTISFNGMKNKFEFTPAAVRTPFEEYSLQYTDEILGHLARGAAAGGVFLRELRNDVNSGDSADRTAFERHFMLARGQGLEPKQTGDQMWANAQAKVQRDLQDEDFRRFVLARATEIESQCFSL